MSSCLRPASLHLFRRLATFSQTSRRYYVHSEVGSVYYGPLAKTFRNLKIFSLSSFGLAMSIMPLFFIIESGLPMSARAALAVTTLGTSGISTALVGWAGAPYVSTLRRLPDGGGVEMETTTLFLKGRYTTVYDSRLFLRETGRSFAKWELARTVEGRKEENDGLEETVAETKDVKGRVLGRWIVRWKGEKGECREEGKMIRYFNVHEELL